MFRGLSNTGTEIFPSALIPTLLISVVIPNPVKVTSAIPSTDTEFKIKICF
jgi:hypothetical protein